jgi:uncharacterized membrane protein YjjP (DUF1212 family)
MTEPRPPLTETLDVLLRFGALMLRAGDTAFRVREATARLAAHMGIENLSLQVTLDALSATVRREGETATLTCDVGAPGINAARIGALERLAESSQPGLTAEALARDLDRIEKAPGLHALPTVAIAIGLASAAFSYLNGGDLLATGAAAIAGATGQAVRAVAFRRQLNQYAVTAVAAVVASGLYCLIVFGFAGRDFSAELAVGFISAALFLVPGFPLVASLLDLVQHQTVAGMARLFYATMILLAAAFGLSAVTAVAGLTDVLPPDIGLGYEPVTLSLRALASFAGGCGFALLYNSPLRTVLAVGLLSLAGNELRLALHDAGLSLPVATFVGALAVGLLASLGKHWLREPRICFTVPGIIIMTPGILAFRTIVLLNEGDVLAAVEALAGCCFIVGGMALGLATARFMSERRWIVER